MPFNPNIPQSTDFLNDSQLQLLQNNLQLDASFGVNHFTFSNLTADNGKHKEVTTPFLTGDVHRTATASDVQFYTMRDTANIGPLQYSRGWDAINSTSAVPSPVTLLQSQAAGLSIGAAPATLNVLDFTGITNLAMGTIYVYSKDATVGKRFYLNYDVVWNGTSFTLNLIKSSGATGYTITSSGNILQISNGSSTPGASEIFWVLDLRRIQV